MAAFSHASCCGACAASGLPGLHFPSQAFGCVGRSAGASVDRSPRPPVGLAVLAFLPHALRSRNRSRAGATYPGGIPLDPLISPSFRWSSQMAVPRFGDVAMPRRSGVKVTQPAELGPPAASAAGGEPGGRRRRTRTASIPGGRERGTWADHLAGGPIGVPFIFVFCRRFSFFFFILATYKGGTEHRALTSSFASDGIAQGDPWACAARAACGRPARRPRGAPSPAAP